MNHRTWLITGISSGFGREMTQQQFGANVFGLDSKLPQMEVAKKSIELVKEFLFQMLGLKSTLTELGIDDTNFEIMAKKAVTGGTQHAFKPLEANDIEAIFKMCL